MNGEGKRLSFYLSKPHCSTIWCIYVREISMWGKVNNGLRMNPSFLLLLKVCGSSALFSSFSLRSATHIHPSISFPRFVFVYIFCHIHFACGSFGIRDAYMHAALYATHLDAKCSSHIQISMCLTVIDLDNNAKKYVICHAMQCNAFSTGTQHNMFRCIRV